jgi:hypothetical protein
VTRTTVTPPPGVRIDDGFGDPLDDGFDEPAGGGRSSAKHGRLAPPRIPLEGPSALRVALSLLLVALCLLTVGGAVLVLMLWQQDRSSGVLTSQLDRTWDLFDLLRDIERYTAYGTIPVAVTWIVLATVNVRRATGKRRNPVVAAMSLVVGVAGVWFTGDQVVAPSADWLGQASGYVLQLVFLAVPLLALERVCESAEARHGALRSLYVFAAAWLAQMQFLGGLSTVERTDDPTQWARLGSYLVIGALLQVLGALAANEAARAIEDGTDNRYSLRNRFGESLLEQAAGR